MRNVDVSHLLENYESLLLAETALFSAFSGVLNDLRIQVKKRDWQALEKTVEKLNSTGEDISKIENARHVAFCGIKEKYGLFPDAPIKVLSPFLCKEWRKKLNSLSVKLKLEVIKVQTQAKSLNCYTKSVSTFLTQFFQELFPHTKGKIYSRKGKAKENSENPYIVNQEL